MKTICVLEQRLGGERRVLKNGEDRGLRGNGTKKRIVQKYTTCEQQIGRTLRDKGEKEWKEVGASAENNTYLKQVHKTKKNTISMQNRHDAKIQ